MGATFLEKIYTHYSHLVSSGVCPPFKAFMVYLCVHCVSLPPPRPPPWLPPPPGSVCTTHFLHAQTFMFFPYIASLDFLFFFFIETQMAWQRDAPVQTKTGCRHRETSRRRREGKNRSLQRTCRQVVNNHSVCFCIDS